MEIKYLLARLNKFIYFTFFCCPKKDASFGNSGSSKVKEDDRTYYTQLLAFLGGGIGQEERIMI